MAPAGSWMGKAQGRNGWIRGGVAGFARLGLLGVAVAWFSGCTQRQPPVLRISNPWLGAMRVAVAPALNFSGSADFDGYAVADLMASELSLVDGFEILPVSRTLAVLSRQGVTGIESPAHAQEVRELLGADAILVFAITEYDPYEPPVVGIAAQLYGRYPGDKVAGLDPIRVARSPSPVSGGVARPANVPLAQTTGVRNAAHEPVVREVRDYARARGGDDSPYGWRKYVVSQQSYLRFCCHAAIKELVQRGVVGDLPDIPNQAG